MIDEYLEMDENSLLPAKSKKFQPEFDEDKFELVYLKLNNNYRIKGLFRFRKISRVCAVFANVKNVKFSCLHNTERKRNNE
jgi:hypothetical protein